MKYKVYKFTNLIAQVYMMYGCLPVLLICLENHTAVVWRAAHTDVLQNSTSV